MAELLNKKEYYDAIELILKSRKAAAMHKEFTCIADLSARLQDTLDITEEKLDLVLSRMCYNFDEKTFKKLRRAYGLLGKTQAAMEQLHMYYSSAVNESSVQALKSFAKESDIKFQDLCLSVSANQAPYCLLKLAENLFLIMRSYYLLVKWHFKHDEDEIPNDSTVFDIERNVSREYIRQKLKAGLLRIWHDVQAKVSTFLKSASLEDCPFEKFILILGILRKLTQVAEIFCGDKSDVLQDFIKNNSVVYIKNYHKGRMEELKLFLENEGWEICPVKSTFNILNLQEFKQFKKFLNRNESIVKNQSETASSVNSQDDSVYISKYFNENTKHTPFDIFKNENASTDDIFGLETQSDESDDEPEELKRDYVDENDSEYTTINPKSNSNKVKNTVIVANTTLSVLRNCGQYLQICRYLPQISLEVIMLMYQLFDYYLYSVHYFFTTDLEVSSSSLYSTKLNAILKRITNNMNNDKNCPYPDIPSHIDLKSEEHLHGLSERIVAVESVIFLAKQFELLHPYLESIIAQPQRMIIDHFKDNTITIVSELRLPIYMASASKSIEARSTLIAMSQVKWDVKTVAIENSPYVDMIVRKIQVFALRLDIVLTKISLSKEVVTAIWGSLAKYIIHLLVEGYSNASKCTNAGRGLMQLDYRQLFEKFEKISLIKPMPYQDYVDRYVKAYYLPRKGLEEFVLERTEYSHKQLLALVACACENKKDRQALVGLIEGRERENT